MKSNLFLLLLILGTTYACAQQTVTIRGSESLIFLGQRFASLYSHHNPNMQFKVAGGSLEEAFRELNGGHADIVEVEGGSERAALHLPIGIQAIAVYVNKDNPIKELTVAQLRGIFMGEIKSWKELGGPDRRILMYSGDNDLTVNFFQDYVLHGEEAFALEGKATFKDMIDAVQRDAGAIGIARLTPTPLLKLVPLKAGAVSLAVTPSPATIRNHEYPITRYVYWNLAHKPSGELKDFCAWVFSSEGQLVVESAGFEPLLPNERASQRAALGLSDGAQAEGK